MQVSRDYIRFPFILLALVFGGAGCGSSTGPEASLGTARERWARLGIQSYSITVSRSCHCTPEQSEPAVVAVRDGVVESRTYVRTGLPVAAPDAASYPTIEEMFSEIETGLENGWGTPEVSFHPIFGFPTRYVFGDPAVDAPVTFARDLTKL